MYENKIILAPMVRVGTLPMRLQALEYGADLVYTEELIDWKLLNSKRVQNHILKTVDYIDVNDGSIVFQTNEEERGRVVLQLGTADEDRAVRVGKLVQGDVAALDINMGCPKEFSIKGGMGVALLHNAEKAKSILKALVKELKIPVTCKIRLLETQEATINLAKEFEKIGIAAIGVHGRTKAERPQHAVHVDIIKSIAESLSIPVICNGGSRDIDKYADILRFRDRCGASSVMVARSAQQNMSIFRKAGNLPIEDVIKSYLRKCIKYLHQPTKTKYCIQSILRELQETPRGKRFLETQTLEQICDIWDLGNEYRETYQSYVDQGYQDVRVTSAQRNGTDVNGDSRKRKSDDNDGSRENIVFIRTNFKNTDDLPKSVMFSYAVKKGQQIPVYETEQRHKLFRSVMRFDGKEYATSYWEKNKKFAEQGAALAGMLALGLICREDLFNSGSLVA